MTIRTYYTLRSIEHNGVKVYYAVDFQKQKVSIVDNEWKWKSFLFTGRELSYQQGWHDILDAIKHAMDAGFTELKEYADEENQKMADKILSMVDY